MKFCGEITYFPPDTSVHSDICFNCNPQSEDKLMNDDYRQFLHNCLDEWLNNSNGTGAFWLGNPSYFVEWGN